MTSDIDLLALHYKTLHVLDENGDMLTSNDPLPSQRRRSKRVGIAWNESGVHTGFRDDVAPEVRSATMEWIDAHLPASLDHIPALASLAEIHGVELKKVNRGPAYVAQEQVPLVGQATRLTPENAHLLKEGFLEPGEIHALDPSFAVLADGRFRSTCQTVRRTDTSIEAGTDTEEPYRGRGFAVQATTAWINAALERNLMPFYSTSSDNTASQRVAEKSGLIQFSTELGIS